MEVRVDRESSSKVAACLGRVAERLMDHRAVKEEERASGAQRRSKGRGVPRGQSSLVVQHEMDWYRRGQALPYWHHDRRS